MHRAMATTISHAHVHSVAQRRRLIISYRAAIQIGCGNNICYPPVPCASTTCRLKATTKNEVLRRTRRRLIISHRAVATTSTHRAVATTSTRFQQSRSLLKLPTAWISTSPHEGAMAQKSSRTLPWWSCSPPFHRRQRPPLGPRPFWSLPSAIGALPGLCPFVV